MIRVRVWIAAVAAVCAAGCADGAGSLSSPSGPSSLGPTTPAAPSSCATLSAPEHLSATVNGTAVSLAWSPVDEADDYVVQVGSTPVTSDILFTSTVEAHQDLERVDPGTHYARVYSHNWCGTSGSPVSVSFTISQ